MASFHAKTLAVQAGKSVGDMLKEEVDEAVDVFSTMPNIARTLQPLKDLTCYLTSGQPSPALSGGEQARQ